MILEFQRNVETKERESRERERESVGLHVARGGLAASQTWG